MLKQMNGSGLTQPPRGRWSKSKSNRREQHLRKQRRKKRRSLGSREKLIPNS
jgi:hypothetical protein